MYRDKNGKIGKSLREKLMRTAVCNNGCSAIFYGSASLCSGVVKIDNLYICRNGQVRKSFLYIQSVWVMEVFVCSSETRKHILFIEVLLFLYAK